MCEQTEVNYLDGDIVWVKLGPCWWPGEVCDVSKLPVEIVKAFKKQPIAVVKFFQEDQYEYVKNLNHIYKYNCRKKNEFIKKGLDMHRAKNAFMDKFPADVCHAESITGGDPDIITSDLFAPEQKPSYSAIFGTPTQKKTPKSGGRGRHSVGTSKTPRPSSLSPQKRITHPRFVGKSDHEVRILEQTTPTAASSHYTCHICGFESSRLNVIVLHNRAHSNGTYVSPAKQKTKKQHTVPKKGKKLLKSFATTSSIDEDLELIRQGVTLTVGGDSTDTESDKEPHAKSAKRKNNKGGANNASKKAKVSSICNNLLADWGDSDSNEESATTTADKPTASEPTEPKEDARTDTMNKSVHNELLADWDDRNSDDEPGGTAAAAPEKPADVSAAAAAAGSGVGEKASCFDFDEEVEHAAATTTVLQKSPGRKIPRVIPQKRISQDAEDSMETDQPITTKPDVDKSETEESKDEGNSTEEDSSVSQDNVEEKSKKDTELVDMQAFKSILDETAVPEVPTIQDISKSREKTFDDSSSILEKSNGVLKPSDIELPSTSDTNETETEKQSETPVTSPKKRIVRNFEEFENLLNEQQSKTEDESSSTAGESSVEVSKLKSQLMSKLTESPAAKQPVTTTTDAETESETNEPDDDDDEEEEEEREDLIQEPEKKKKSRSDSEDSDIDDEERKTDTPKDKVPQEDKDDAVQKKDKVDEEAEMPEVEEQEQEDIINDVATESAESTTMDTTAGVEASEEQKIEKTSAVVEEDLEKPAANESMETSLIETPLHTPIEEVTEENTLEASSSETVEASTPVETTFEETILEEIPETTTIVESVPEEKLQEEKLPEDKQEEIVVNEYPTEVVSEIVENVPEISEEIKEQEQVEEMIEETVPEVQETITEEEHRVVEKVVEEERVEDIPLPPTRVEEQTFHQEEIIVEKEKVEEETSFVEETIATSIAEDSRSQKMLVDISDICIDNTDNLSGLTTLAAVSELTGNLYDKPEAICQPSPSLPTEIKEQEIINNESPIVPPCTVSEEVETTEEIIQEMPAAAAAAVEPEQHHEKPVRTLANFSMDFSDSNSESAVIKPVEEDDKIPEVMVDTQEIPAQETQQPVEILEPIQTVETEIPNDFESIESEIEKITSIETHSDKLNSFPENISHPTDTIDNATTITYPDYTLSEASTTITTTTISHEFGTQPVEEQVVHAETTTLESEIAKLTDTHPDTENVVQEQQQNTTSSKLLEILTDSKKLKAESQNTAAPARTVITAGGSSQKVHMVITGDSKSISKKFDPKTSKFVIKSATSKAAHGGGKSNRPIILSEKIIKPVTETENVSVKKVTSKRSYQDVEDIDTFIIQKPSKKANMGESMDQQDIILTPKTDALKFKSAMRSRGKPKIIEQTIIKAADVPVQVSVSESQQLLDDAMFDINSMPIVLSDQILTPESIENMPVVMTDLMPSSTATVITEKPQQTVAVKRGGTLQQVKLLNKSSRLSTAGQPVESPGKMGQNVVVKNIMPRGLGKNQKVYQTGGTKLKNNPAVITTPGKPGRFIILPSSTTTTSGGSKYTVGKRLSTVKSVTSVSSSPTTSKLKGLPSSNTVEPTGNKIMIVTNQQGVQSRVLLTPAQQKMLGCKMPTTKAKSPSQHMKGGVMQKSILTSKGTIMAPVNSSGTLIPSQKSSSLASQTIVSSKGQLFTTGGQTLVTSEGQVLTPITQQQLKTLKSEQHKVGKKLQIQSSRVILPDKGESSQKGKMNLAAGAKTKTILIKGTQGQTLKKIQTPINETKNIALSSSHKTSPLISISSSQMSGKQVMLTSKGQLIKQDMKVGGGGMTKQYGADKLQRVQSPKVSVGGGQSHRIVAKSPRAQMMLGAVSKQHLVSSAAVPPLAPITASQSKKDTHAQQIIKQNEQKLAAALIENKEIELADKAALEQKQPNQLIIQDTLGNQTTVTEGQILALPSETIDGQPQSYVLVTVDETGNLVPISNDTLMSLDPSLAAGGDMSNIVLQIDQGAQENQPAELKTTLPPTSTELPVDNQQFAVMNQQQQQQQQQAAVETTEQQQQMITMDNQQLILPEQNILTSTAGAEQQMIVTDNQQVFMDKEQETFVTNPEETQVITSDPSTLMQDNQTAVACSINSGDTSQQLIITGDPESTQKFLASLSEGNTDLSSLLSSTDGNIIINTDGQQILLNPDSDNQILLSVNSDNLGLIQTNPESDAATYVTQQAMKNQDILAAALADTDVFQQESAAVEKGTSQALTKVSSSAQSQLSPNSNLYPMSVGNVLETSLTLGSPIMTPLEVPSVNNKKINAVDVESTLISRVRSSLELPITITDPSISQTVSQQVMLSNNDLQTNLELPITMSDTGITSIRSSDMNSPSFVYSLPTLDDNSDLEQKRVFTETSSAVITTDNLYNTTLTGSMSMPLLTEEPEIAAVETEQTNAASAEDAPTVSTASETVTSEIIGAEHDEHDHQSTNYPVVSVGESLQPSMSEKISSDLQMGAIEEELDLNATDICSSLSEPPPGMFDNIVNPRYLSNKPEQEESVVANIPLPPQDTTTTAPSIAETTNSTNENNSLLMLSDGTENNSLLNEPISSLPMLSDGTENETGNSADMMTNSSGVTEKSPTESNLDMDYGVSESSDQHSLSETAVNQDVPRSEMSGTPNSDLNSPRLDIDEASTEIPIQPPIITSLADNFENNTHTTPTTTTEAEEFTLHSPMDESRKRRSEDREDREEDMEDAAKRTKLSCD